MKVWIIWNEEIIFQIKYFICDVMIKLTSIFMMELYVEIKYLSRGLKMNYTIYFSELYYILKFIEN